MAVPAELALNPSHYPYWRLTRWAADVCMASVVIIVGVAGLSADCWLRKKIDPVINIHLLFGALLCGWLLVRIRVRLTRSPAMRPGDLHDLSRQHSRIAYLVLYAVIGTKLCVSFVTGGHSPLDAHPLSGPGRNPFDVHDDYQMCLASGLIALIVVRMMLSRLRTP